MNFENEIDSIEIYGESTKIIRAVFSFDKTMHVSPFETHCKIFGDKAKLKNLIAFIETKKIDLEKDPNLFLKKKKSKKRKKFSSWA